MEEAERNVTLAALGVEKHPREQLARELGMAGWWLPGQQPREPVVREPGVPDWWHGGAEASSSFLTAMGIKL